VIHPDGTRITPVHLQASAANYFAFEPNWSQDGARIVLAMCVSGEEDIYTAKPDGSDLKNVTNVHASCSGVGFENGPDWAIQNARPQRVFRAERRTTSTRRNLRKSAIRFRIWIRWTQIEFASQPHRVAHCTAGHAHRTKATPVAAAHCNVCLAEEARGLATLVSSKRSRMPRLAKSSIFLMRREIP
jgi:hypothetical protein